MNMLFSGTFPTRIFKAAERGVAALEFALIAPVLVLFLFGAIEVSLIMLTQHLLENATYNASRLGKTGHTETSKTQLDTVTDYLLTQLQGYAPLIDIAKLSFSTTSYGDLSLIDQPDQGEVGVGAAQEVVVYTITYPWEISTPMIGKLMGDAHNVINLTSRIVVRNEPYN